MIRPNAFDTSWMTNAISSRIMWAGYSRSQVLERLAPRQPGQPVAEPVHLGTDPVRVGPGVVAQRPADRLAQPERGVVDVASIACRSRSRSVSAGGRPGRSRRSAAPTGRRRSPTPGPPASSRSDAPASTSPTRWVAISSTTSHQAPVTTRCRQSVERLAGSSHAPRAPVPGHREGGVPLLAVGRLVPQRADGASHCSSSAGRQSRSSGRAPPSGGAPGGRGRASRTSCTPAAGPPRPGRRRRERAAYGLDERPVCGGRVGHPPQTSAPSSPSPWSARPDGRGHLSPRTSTVSRTSSVPLGTRP